MAQKTVLIVEDKPVVREQLKAGLEILGIHTIVAASADEARQRLVGVPDVDVVVLDIRLGDNQENGFDFGLRLKNERSEWPPEFLIHSAYENVDYFQAALKLGVAAYLKKAGDSNVALTRVEVVTQHVRALMLRRSFQNPAIADLLQSIIARSGSPEKAIERFCREILAEELESTLGRNYVLLLTRGEKTEAVSGCLPLTHASNTSLQQLQSAIHARLSTEPFVVNPKDALSPSALEREALQRVLVSIDGTAFVDLGGVESARLSIGLIPGGRSPEAAEAVKEQVKLLDRYLQKPLIAQLLAITGKWAALDLERRLEIHKRELVLEMTSQFCLYQSEEIGVALQESPEEQDGGGKGLAAQVNRLKAIANEMQNAGEMLGYFVRSSAPMHREPGFDIAEIVEQVWTDEVSHILPLSQPGMLKVVGHCQTSDQRERAERTVSQILGWMGRRLIRSGAEGAGLLAVECLLTEGGKRVQVIFEEHSSRRLSGRLRESLFEPFFTRLTGEPTDEIVDGGRRLGLYLSKTLAGLAGGALEDHSDELTGGLGHRFVLELPAAVSDVV
jgi:DNA-binding NarL/FixJ family response regulator